MPRPRGTTCTICGSPRDAKSPLQTHCKACAARLAREARQAYRDANPLPVKPIPTDRRCPGCKTVKPLSDFGKANGRYLDKHSYCLACMRQRALKRYHADTPRVRSLQNAWAARNPEKVASIRRRTKLKNSYGLTVEEYDAIADAQGCKCAICGRDPIDNRWNVLYVDHDHVTGRIRVLLCQPCNFAIGQLDDDLDRMKSLIAYIERSRDSESEVI